MRIDWYTKGVLTVIAVLLGMIALRPYVSPDAVQAQGSFAGVEMNDNHGPTFFDTRTGEYWEYDGHGNLAEMMRLTKLGQRMVKEK